MKYLTTLLCLASLSASAHADFAAIITQRTTHENGATTFKILTQTNDLTGHKRLSRKIPVRAEFELFSLDKETGASRSLDLKTVGTYLPEASLRIEARDSLGGVAKTLEGSTFRVSIDVEGLVSNDPNAQEAAKRVRTFRYFKKNNSIFWRRFNNYVDTPKNGPSTDLYGDIFQATTHGQERFVTFALPDYTTEYPQYSILDTTTINVFPKMKVTLQGVPTQPLRSLPNSFQYELRDIYPGLSDHSHQTFCGILFYKGARRATLTQADITNHLMTSQRLMTSNFDSPQNQTLRPVPTTEMNQVFTTAGVYTMETIQVTPHGIDRPIEGSATVQYEPPLQINANINTAQ